MEYQSIRETSDGNVSGRKEAREGEREQLCLHSFRVICKLEGYFK